VLPARMTTPPRDSRSAPLRVTSPSDLVLPGGRPSC
jgi:hypothetical protein